MPRHDTPPAAVHIVKMNSELSVIDNMFYDIFSISCGTVLVQVLV